MRLFLENIEIFQAAFSETFFAILIIFIIIIAAGILVRKSVVTQEQITALSRVTVEVFLPCMIFANIIRTFDPHKLTIWWVLPLSAVLLTAGGLLLGYLFFFRELPAKKNMLALTGLQNAGYLILPIGAVIYADRFDTFALYVFLFIPGVSPILWSVGKYLSTAGETESLSWKGLITPPLMANIFALTLVFLGMSDWFNNPQGEAKFGVFHALLQGIDLLGNATVPLATFILGAVLGSISIRLRPYFFDALRVVFIKLFVLPLVVVLFLFYTSWHQNYPLLCDFFVLQAAAPPATGLILQVRRYGGNEQKLGSLMVLSYIVCIFTLPLWLAVWHSINTV